MMGISLSPSLEYGMMHVFLQGHDTVSAALGHTIHLLGAHLEVQRKCQLELDEIIGTNAITFLVGCTGFRQGANHIVIVMLVVMAWMMYTLEHL